jgi:hypothetical protein
MNHRKRDNMRQAKCEKFFVHDSRMTCFFEKFVFFLVLRFFGRQAALAEEARRRRQREEEVSDAVVVAV